MNRPGDDRPGETYPNHPTTVAEDITPAITGTALAAMAPDAVRHLWKTGILVAEQNSDFFSKLEGGRNSVVPTVTDTAKGAGQRITFTTMSGFYGEGKLADARFDDPTDFESIDMSSFDLKVDWIRNAYSINDRTEEVMGMRGEIASGANVELGKWLGRTKTEHMFAEFQLRLNSANVLYTAGASTEALKSAHVLDMDAIITAAHSMRGFGGQPANIGKGEEIWSNIVVAASPSLLSLKLDPDYKTMLANADQRGGGNHIFKGAYPDIDGQVIMEYNPIDHDGIGAIGSFLNPKALLGVAVTAGTATFDIKGGGNSTDAALTAKKYFKYFAGYAYPFIDGTSYSPASATDYVLIYNVTGSDAGKFGFYSYANATGNNGNKLVVAGRLAAAASGIAATTLGNVTWNATYNTDAHPEGSLILPCNSYGVPFGHTLILGKHAAMRGYGKYRGKRSTQRYEGDFIEQRFITSVFGQTITKDRKARHIAAIRLTHAISYPGVTLPVIS